MPYEAWGSLKGGDARAQIEKARFDEVKAAKDCLPFRTRVRGKTRPRAG